MRILSLITPPFDARINVPWGVRHVLSGLLMVIAIAATTLTLVSLVFDGPAPLWVVLGSTLALHTVMLAAATRLGPGRFGALAVLLGPRRLAILPLYSWAAATFVASLVVGAVYVVLASKVSPELVPPPLPEAINGGELRGLTFLVVVMLGPFVEEVFFRGFVFSGLLHRFGLSVAIVVSAAVFAMAHMDAAMAGPAFFSGLVFALVYWRTGTLWPLVLAHTAQNAIAFALTN